MVPCGGGIGDAFGNMTAGLPSGLRQALHDILGKDLVLEGEDDRRFFSHDIFEAGATAAAVIRPGTVEQLATAVRNVTTAGFAVVPRGGGVSYTGGYLPESAASVMVDTRALDRVIDVNTTDMYVTVEAGCTWEQLSEVLEGTGTRTPFGGPFSGRYATVGGTLSQNAILWGSAAHGGAADSVLGLGVVLADGTLVRTGSAATSAGSPFHRYFGPDLTGAFLGDSGALGIKVEATLPLMPKPAAARFASFSFRDRRRFVDAMADVARSGTASTCFGLDPLLQYQRVRKTRLREGARKLRGVVAAAETTVAGLREAAAVALRGRRVADVHGYALHVIVEGRSAEAADAAIAEITAMSRAGSRQLPDSVPRVMAGNPYVSLAATLGPEGERWIPTHGIFPLSAVNDAWDRLDKLFAHFAAPIERFGIVTGLLTAVVGTGGCILEVVLYWPGPRNLWHERMLDPSKLSRYRDFEDDPEVDRVIVELRSRLIETFHQAGAAHLQIGKRYPYLDGLDPGTRGLLEAIKDHVDPHRLTNPGSLGL